MADKKNKKEEKPKKFTKKQENERKEAWKRIKCYTGIPKEFEGKKMERVKSDKKSKFIRIEEVSKFKSMGNKK